MLIVAVVICAVLYILYSTAGYLALFVLVCTRGIVLVISVAQRFLMGCVLSGVQRSGTGPERLSVNRVLGELFGILPNVDGRAMTM